MSNTKRPSPAFAEAEGVALVVDNESRIEVECTTNAELADLKLIAAARGLEITGAYDSAHAEQVVVFE